MPAAVSAAPVEQVVPYSGILDRDGAPVSGVVRLRFRAFTAPDAVAADGDPCNAGACVWTETHPEVPVHNGAFTVRLGRPVGAGAVPQTIAPILRQNQQYYLEVAVGDDQVDRWLVLGRQALHPVPQTIFTLQEDVNLRTLRATEATVGRVHVTENGTYDALRVGNGEAAPNRLELRLGQSSVLVADTSQAPLGPLIPPGTLVLNPFGGEVRIGTAAANLQPASLNVTGAVRFSGNRPFEGLRITFHNNFSGFDEFEDTNLGIRHDDGRNACFLQTMAIGINARVTNEICELVRNNDGNYHLVARGRADTAVRCAAGCLSW